MAGDGAVGRAPGQPMTQQHQQQAHIVEAGAVVNQATPTPDMGGITQRQLQQMQGQMVDTQQQAQGEGKAGAQQMGQMNVRLKRERERESCMCTCGCVYMRERN